MKRTMKTQILKLLDVVESMLLDRYDGQSNHPVLVVFRRFRDEFYEN